VWHSAQHANAVWLPCPLSPAGPCASAAQFVTILGTRVAALRAAAGVADTAAADAYEYEDEDEEADAAEWEGGWFDGHTFHPVEAAPASNDAAADAAAGDLALQLVNLLRTQIAEQVTAGSADAEAGATSDLAARFVDLLRMSVAEQMPAPIADLSAAAAAAAGAAADAAAQEDGSAEASSSSSSSSEPREHLIGGQPAVFCYSRSQWSREYAWGAGASEHAAVVPGNAGVIRTRLNPSAPTSMTQVTCKCFAMGGLVDLVNVAALAEHAAAVARPRLNSLFCTHDHGAGWWQPWTSVIALFAWLLSASLAVLHTRVTMLCCIWQNMCGTHVPCAVHMYYVSHTCTPYCCANCGFFCWLLPAALISVTSACHSTPNMYSVTAATYCCYPCRLLTILAAAAPG
jgi:hypothetical protein